MIEDDTITVNGEVFKLAKNANCQTDNIIYYAKCSLCQTNNSYFGRTLQEWHNRTSGHRGCFNVNDYEKSAVSMHAMVDHKMNCGMDNFNFAIIKRTHPLNLHREEFIHIDRARTLCLGLNRMKVNH